MTTPLRLSVVATVSLAKENDSYAIPSSRRTHLRRFGSRPSSDRRSLGSRRSRRASNPPPTTPIPTSTSSHTSAAWATFVGARATQSGTASAIARSRSNGPAHPPRSPCRASAARGGYPRPSRLHPREQDRERDDADERRQVPALQNTPTVGRPVRAPVESISSRPARTTGASYRASDRTPSR
jgi:hypothetical protein